MAVKHDPEWCVACSRGKPCPNLCRVCKKNEVNAEAGGLCTPCWTVAA